MYLARFLDGRPREQFWASQYQAFTLARPDTVKRIFRASAVHTAALAALAALPRAGRVLDAGCGPGILALLDAGQREVVGIDPSELLVRRAEWLAPHARFIVGSAEDL